MTALFLKNSFLGCNRCCWRAL